MLAQPINFLSWNVRGLNCPDRRSTVNATIASSSCHVVCLQETKLDNIDQFTAAFLGGHRLCSFAQRPANGTRGGILLLWDDLLLEMSNITFTTYCLSAMVRVRDSGVRFKITTVYGPTDPSLKDAFFAELISQKPPVGVAWIASGDFNQIYRARDKNKRNVNTSRINRFRATLTSCELKEIHLQNRRFTWSNERANPTLSKLDSFFCNADWDTTFNDHVLHALSSSLSDHCPLLLADDKGPRRPKTFKFENFWTSMPGFSEVVQKAWVEPVEHTEPHIILFHKPKKTAMRLSQWSRGLFSKAKVHLHAALLVILRLDIAQERRLLSPEELDLRARLKRRVISLAVLEKARKKQCARIANIKEGDA
uniref:Endonuclease/exonuclease/phosphatase domain-containing protein n=1 Tax=Aegilops tauschii subsp. strangulata TaxID=200361 RepID=A0A453DFS4_AEGTS